MLASKERPSTLTSPTHKTGKPRILREFFELLCNFRGVLGFQLLEPMKTPPNNDPSNELKNVSLAENDPLWELLNESPAPEASPFFSRNILREIRAEEQQKTSLWKAFLSFRPAVAMGLTVAVALSCIPLILSSQDSKSRATASLTPTSNTSLVNYLDEELLLAAADEPSLFSDDEVIAMLF